MNKNKFYHKSFFVPIILLTLSLQPLSSSPVLEVTDTEKVRKLGEFLERLDDPEEKLTIEVVSSPEYDSRFQPVTAAVPNIKFTDRSVWFRFRAKSKTAQTNRWILEIDYPLIDSIELYTPRPQGGYEKETQGEVDRSKLEKSHYPNPHFLLTEDGDKSVIRYIRVADEGSVTFPGLIHSESTFRQKIALRQVVLGMYYGLILGLFIYNLFLFFTVRDISYLYYVLYVLGYSILQGIVDGYANLYLWPAASPWVSNRMLLVWAPFFIFWLLFFTRVFLQLKEFFPRVERIFYQLAWANIIFIPAVFILNYAIVASLWIVVGLVSVIFFLYAAISSFMKGYRPARYFLTAFSMFFVGGVLWGFRFLDILPSNFITENTIKFGSAAQVLLLSIALGDRINIMKKEKEEAQKETIQNKEKALQLQQALTDAYQRFVPHEFLENLGKESILDIKLGDQTQKNMSILFSDIRNFTAMSENMSAEENFAFINNYLGTMVPLVRENNGFIDKYIGDSIMALFPGSPDDALNTAIAMLIKLRGYNDTNKARLHRLIRIGIGINTGNLMLGTVGEENRLDGTVISDAVNLTSRIESLTKSYGTAILISENTYASLTDPERFYIRFVDCVNVRGKKKAVNLYEVMNADPLPLLEKKRELNPFMQDAWNLYNEREYEKAKIIYERCIAENPGDRLAKAYAIRCKNEIA